MQKPEVIRRWHQMLESGDTDRLPELLADDVTFLSPIVHTPQEGKAVTLAYLGAAASVLGGEGFRYVCEWYSDGSAVLEFETVVDGIQINGVDMIWWNEGEQITRFKVMVRPLKAIQLVHGMMARQLQEQSQASA